MKAVKRFDPERNVRLVSFAIHWIKAEIHEYILRNWRLVKLATTKAQRLFFNLRSMKTGLAPMTSKEVKRIASELRVKPEEVVEMETRLGPGDRLRGRRGRRGRTRRCITSPPTATPSRSRSSRQRSPRRCARPGLDEALKSLDPRSRRIIEARWLREKNALTLHDLAGEFKVSAERIRQIEAKALEKMKKAMQSERAAPLQLPAPASA